MSLGNYRYFIRKRLSGNRLLLILNFFVSAMALAAACMAVTIPQISRHGERAIGKALAGDLSAYGVVHNGGQFALDENCEDYIKAIYDAPEIAGVGFWEFAGWKHMETAGSDEDLWAKMEEIQRSSLNAFGEEHAIPGVLMPGYAFPINDLDLCLGSTEQMGQNGEWLLYLGYDYREIPIDTVFVSEQTLDHKEKPLTWRVAGVFEEGSAVVDSREVIYNFEDFKLICSIPMDNMILLVPPADVGMNYLCVSYFFMAAEGYSYGEAAARIREISEEYGYRVETGTLSNRIDTIFSYFDWVLEGLRKLSGLLLFSAFVILLTAQMLALLSRKAELGVWLVSGLDRKSIFRILLGENLVKMLQSSILAFGIVALFEWIIGIMQQDMSSAYIAYELRYILWGNIPVFLLLGGAVMAVVCSLVSILYLKGKSIPEIVRGTWE